ncbi:cyanophycin synthetase [Clostridium sp. BJN0001]|uniref:cyanophycin synthetase n=1 Tax=Clostridium sp. BJN0001 TaxID=2930219 RepID=UPI001FD3A72C|nr:cyanophycin synthetase [Clostridium sp. BJN0001]
MKIIDKRVYENKNIYSYKKCIRVDVDLEGYCEVPSKDIPNFNFNLIKMIPELKKHRCGIDEEGGFVKRLKEGTYLAHICEHICIALQNKFGIDVSYGKAREIKEDSYYIILEYQYKNTAISCIYLAVDIINSLINQIPIEFEGRIEQIKHIFLKEELGPSTKAICLAAKDYNLPVIQLYDSGFYQIGYGKMGRMFEATIGNATNCIGVDISCDKLLTKNMLNNQNIPVAKGEKVLNVMNLLINAEEIGYPVVLKPQYGNKGKGIILNIKDEKELVESYSVIKKKFKDIMLEEYKKGKDYRVCVVNYKVVAVSERILPYVIGDGVNDLKSLIYLENENKMRGEDHEKPLTKIKIDDDLLINLKKQNISLNTVIEKDKKVFLRENANLSTGATAIDCTDKICRENIDFCITAAKILQLDICGIDICSNDISVPLDENGGIIMEVNAAPGIRMHHFPSKGESHNVGKAILNMFYNNRPANIPVISVTGTNGKTTTTRLISYVLRKVGYNIGMTSTDGVFLNEKCIHKGDDSGFNSAKTILMNKDIDIAVLETARGGIIKKGLAYEEADVAVITNITNDHLGLNGIDTMKDLCFVKSLVGEAVKKNGYVVVNADDKYSKEIISRLKSNIIYFSKNKNNPLIEKNIENGGTAVYLNNNNLCVTNKGTEYKLISIYDLPISYNGILKYNIENAMASVAALVGMNIDYCIISKGLRNFKLNSIENRGRFNLYKCIKRNIILDYGHNIEGYKAVLGSVKKSVSTGKKFIGIIGMPGDRKDSDIKKVGEIAAKYLDNIIIKEDVDRRGRKKGEIASILTRAVKETKECVSVKSILNEEEALKYAINISKPNDTIVMFYEKIEPLENIINDLNKENYNMELLKVVQK